MFSLFLFSVTAEEILKTSRLLTVLTVKNWDSVIERRTPQPPWYVMFYGEDCPGCTATAPEFIEAANRTSPLIRYGSVNCSEEPEIARKYQIGHIPTFLIFHSDGYEEAKDAWTTDRLLERLGSHFKGCLIPFDGRWFQETRNSAVLFTYNDIVPVNWKLFSCRLRTVRMGYSRDANLRHQHGAPLAPAVFFINKSHKIHFKEINDAIKNADLFFAGKYKKAPPIVTYFLPFELKSECKPPARLCVAANTVKVSQSFKEAAEQWSGSDIKFFQGDEDWPSRSIKSGDTYLILPGENRFYKVRSEKTLKEMIGRILEDIDSVTWIHY
jgi:thiol-disulfide isomerase/thioredoxin